MANRLADETSPYLRQHAENPVDWYPWSDEAFERARSLDRPVLISVGYSACHWCHVMAHESFEDEPTAELVNELFVNVKVDREERPDVDAVYMDAVQAMTGRGGWPMTVFVTPDGRPFFAGTYFPREPQGGMLSFTDLCRRIDEVWRTRRTEIEEQADAVADAIAGGSDVEPAEELPEATTLAAAATALRGQFDARWGGFGNAPKFPQAMSLDLLARVVARTDSQEELGVLTTSLDAMASGGIYDHLGGGFARYSVDERWHVPHFEKMLYDQALLVRAYLHAWQLTGEPRYRQVLDETVGYVLRDLRRPGGGVASAEDADSDDGSGHQREGAFYVWSADEVRSTLAAGGLDDDEVAQALEWWSVSDAGNFEGSNILWRPFRGDLLRPESIERARQVLFEARLARPRPGLDDKVLTEWNGLWIAALAEAAAATGDEAWRRAAVEDGERLLEVLRRADGRWLRSWQDDGEGGGEARHLAYAADHAALVDAFVRLAELTGEARWIDEARATADAMLTLFADDVHGGLFTTGSDAEQLITRPKDLLDNATPSANSLAALGLLRLAALTGEGRYRERAEGILRLLAEPASRHPTAFAHLLAAVDLHVSGATEVVVSGDRPDLVEAVRSAFRPEVVLAWGERYESPLWEGREETGADGRAYVCRGFVCDAPTATPSATERVLGTVTPQGSGSSTRNEATLSDRRDDAGNWAR